MKYMFFIVLMVPFCAAYNVSPDKVDRWENAIKPHVEKCKLESNVDPVYAERMKYLEYPEDDKFKCFMMCLYQNSDVLDSKGNINIDELAKKYTFDKLEPAKECSEKVKEEKRPCEQAYKLLLCTVNAASE